MNENYTIPAFAEPITDLPDTPGLTAAELKRRFQAPADEVRLAHNALAECVEGITSATYPDTVTEDMLTDALADKINGKADDTANTAAHEALTNRMNALENSVSTKATIYVGSYNGNASSVGNQFINLGFTPRAVIVFSKLGEIDNSGAAYGGVGSEVTENSNRIKIETNGFRVYSQASGVYLNAAGMKYGYIAVK